MKKLLIFFTGIPMSSNNYSANHLVASFVFISFFMLQPNVMEATVARHIPTKITIPKKNKKNIKIAFRITNKKEQTKKMNVLAIIGFAKSVLALASIIGPTSILTIFALPIAISALVLCLLARSKMSNSKLGKGGMGYAIAGALISFVSTILLFVVYAKLGVGIF